LGFVAPKKQKQPGQSLHPKDPKEKKMCGLFQLAWDFCCGFRPIEAQQNAAPVHQQERKQYDLVCASEPVCVEDEQPRVFARQRQIYVGLLPPSLRPPALPPRTHPLFNPFGPAAMFLEQNGRQQFAVFSGDAHARDVHVRQTEAVQKALLLK
jgi:hypothetical protein